MKRPHKISSGSSQGFTLIELMVTISVLAIVTAVATPSILTQLTRMEA
ncbi:prepilin-type N-terminal cleavage/methylation domain-containing protein, partial [Pseudoalteromonas sp. SIMBA_148]